ncbi:uncharacterized protein BDR25DRAFT_349283 [Lindgomyces ingoldianus]|uniref:Uncharacterized protein n=1 Tax=Lindgomyces ingoldianus TaxID=673940 RepID=A0ACB6RA20_9PLEO|nr:uncharacterized protein BDR25DRAFT_349283 [Lindgomyces ingoldianus]KAF2476164.1 hypothetical protein BDR25DRAFT_349283 [Lindgomyces ingoldianus]
MEPNAVGIISKPTIFFSPSLVLLFLQYAMHVCPIPTTSYYKPFRWIYTAVPSNTRLDVLVARQAILGLDTTFHSSGIGKGGWASRQLMHAHHSICIAPSGFSLPHYHLLYELVRTHYLIECGGVPRRQNSMTSPMVAILHEEGEGVTLQDPDIIYDLPYGCSSPRPSMLSSPEAGGAPGEKTNLVIGNKLPTHHLPTQSPSKRP